MSFFYKFITTTVPILRDVNFIYLIFFNIFNNLNKKSGLSKHKINIGVVSFFFVKFIIIIRTISSIMFL